jgi:hypothetical protein
MYLFLENNNVHENRNIDQGNDCQIDGPNLSLFGIISPIGHHNHLLVVGSLVSGAVKVVFKCWYI